MTSAPLKFDPAWIVSNRKRYDLAYHLLTWAARDKQNIDLHVVNEDDDVTVLKDLTVESCKVLMDDLTSALMSNSKD